MCQDTIKDACQVYFAQNFFCAFSCIIIVPFRVVRHGSIRDLFDAHVGQQIPEGVHMQYSGQQDIHREDFFKAASVVIQ